MNSVKLSRRKLLVAIALALSLVMAISYSLTQPTNAQQTHNVTILDFAFHPQNVTIKVGDTILWINNDSVIYTLWFVYAENQTTYEKAGSEGLSEPILPGEPWSWIFDEPVTLQYYSFERLWITGFITVQPRVHDVAVTDVTLRTRVHAHINVTAENPGDFTETFNVILYADKDFTVIGDEITIGNQTVPSLISGNSTTVTFLWIIKGVAPGSYTITAYATPVSGETYITDNTYVDGRVTISPRALGGGERPPVFYVG